MNMIISNAIILMIMLYMGYSLLELKYKNKLINIIIYLVSLIACSLINFNGASSSKAVCLFFVYFAYIYLLFKSKLLNKLMVLIPSFIILLTSEVIVYFVSVINSFTNLDTTIFTLNYNIQLFISLLITTIFSYLYVRIIKYFEINDLPKSTLIILIIPVITIILLVSVPDYYDLINKNKYLLFIIFALFFLDVIVIILFFTFLYSNNMKKKMEINDLKKEISEMKYELLDQQYNNNFNFLHNLLHTCNKLEDYVKDNDYQGIKDEVGELSSVTFKEFNTLYTNSNILNKILTNYYDVISKNSINIKTEIQCNVIPFLNISKQIDLFSLLIELGIEGCKAVDNEHRIIIFKTKKDDNQIIIQVYYSTLSNDINIIKEKINKVINDNKVNISVRKLDSDFVHIIIYSNNEKQTGVSKF